MSDNASRPDATAARVLSNIRFGEVIVLQGAPLIGACFAIGALTPNTLLPIVALTVGSLSLVAHICVFNDWSGIEGDLRDPARTGQTFTADGVTRRQFGLLAILLLATSLVVFAFLGAPSFFIALAMCGLSLLYSAPAFHMKGIPIFGSALHFLGETLHFLLGYATFAAIDARSIVIGCFFGLVYAAGHLMHEVRGYDGDLANGIRTNAVAFGKERTFIASFALFTAAYTLIVVLAAVGAVPRVLIVAGALYPIHLYASLRTWRAGLDLPSLYQLQTCYRVIYALIGVTMIAGLLFSRA